MIALQMTLEQNVCTKSNIFWRNIGTRNTNTYLWFLSHQNLCCNSGSSSSCTFEIIVLIENVWSFELFWHLEHIKEKWRLMHFKSGWSAAKQKLIKYYIWAKRLRQHHTDFMSNQKANLSKANDGQTGFVNMRQLVFNKLIRQQACHKRSLATCKAAIWPMLIGQPLPFRCCHKWCIFHFFTSLIDCVV